MKTRFFIVVFSIFILPTVCLAQVITSDTTGTPIAISEQFQTTMSKMQNSKQVLTLQKVMAKMGSAKSTLSEALNKGKDIFSEIKQKGEEYAGKIKSFGDEAKAYYGAIKDLKEVGADGLLKEKGSALLGGVADKLGVDTDKVEGLASNVSNAIKKEEKTTDVSGVKSGNFVEANELASVDRQAVTGNVDGKAQTVKQDKEVAGLVDVPSSAPTRQPIGGVVGKDLQPVETLSTISQSNVKAKAEAKDGKVVDKAAELSADTVKKDIKAVAKDVEVKEKAKERLLDTNQQVKTEIVKERAAKSFDEVSKKSLQSSAAQSLTVEPQIKKMDVKKEMSVDKSEILPAIELKTIETQPKEIIPMKMQRRVFKSSFGYGSHQSIIPLSFASLSSGDKTNETPEKIMVLPKYLSMYCDLNYEDASKDENMDKCLKKISAISISSVSEDVTKAEITDAVKDFHNGYVEYLAAAFFEAFEIYNDSLTFKSNEIDPFMTTKTSDIDASWTLAKEMHAVLGSRINKLRQLWARTTGMEMYSTYMDEKFVDREEDEETKK